MHRRFFSVIAAAAILVLVIGSVASAGVLTNPTGPDTFEAAEGPPPLSLAATVPATATVGEAMPVGLVVTNLESTTFDGCAAVVVAQVKVGSVVVPEAAFAFAGTLTWTYVADLGWTAPVTLNTLAQNEFQNFALTMTPNGAGTFTVSFWLEETPTP